LGRVLSLWQNFYLGVVLDIQSMRLSRRGFLKENWSRGDVCV